MNGVVRQYSTRVALGAAILAGASARLAAQGNVAADSSDLANRHANPSARISSQNVGQMRRAWHMTTPDPVTHTPLAQNGRVYFADWGGTAYAVDESSGRVLWKQQVEQPKKMWPWHGFAGTGALGEGMLFEASAEGNAFALDQQSGAVKWKTRITNDPQGGSISKMLYYDGLVYIGLSSVEEPLSKMKPGMPLNFRGSVVALDARTGKQVWERPLVAAPHNGVAVWGSFAVDPATNTLYFTTGNNYTGQSTDLADAIVAADAKTGAIRWSKQVTQNDVWTKAKPLGPDYDFGAGPQLFTATINGQPHQLVGAGQKSGTFYAWDRGTGNLVWKSVIGTGGVGGGIHGEASLGDGKVYVWGNNGYAYKHPEKAPMDIAALDAATGKYLWENPKAQPAVEISAGFLANGVYFVGSLDGMVRGYRATDGTKLWTSPDLGSVGSSLMVDNGMLLWGTGVPKNFGGTGGNGVVAFQAGGQSATQPTAAPEGEMAQQPQPGGNAMSAAGSTASGQPSRAAMQRLRGSSARMHVPVQKDGTP